MSQVYYISRDAVQQEGPFTIEEIRGMIATGQFRPEHLLWTSGMTDWSTAAGRSGIFAPEVPPPLPRSEPLEPVATPSRTKVSGGGGTGPTPAEAPAQFVTHAAKPEHAAFGGFWRRVLAASLDTILVVVAAGIVPVFATGGLLLVVVGWLYYSLMESSPTQATLGKMAMGLRVTDMENQRVDFSRATGRFFGKFLSLFTFCIGFIMAAFTTRKQALHDQLASTLVLRTG